MHQYCIRMCLVFVACLGGVAGGFGQVVQTEESHQPAESGEPAESREQRRGVRRLGDFVTEENNDDWTLAIPETPEFGDETEPEASDDAALREELESLLARANSALEDGRITTPPGDNALDYFESVLRLDPQNAAALEGLEEVESQLCFTGIGDKIRPC